MNWCGYCERLVSWSACGSWALVGLWRRGWMAVKLSLAWTVNLLQKVNAAWQRHRCVCVLTNLKSVTMLQLLVCLCPSAIPRSSLQTFGWTLLAKSEWVKILLCVCVRASVCVCWGWGCCHFGNATAHIAAITTAEKCFSATCNYYRLQIAVLASEALARKRETLCVCVWICVCVVTHK